MCIRDRFSASLIELTIEFPISLYSPERGTRSPIFIVSDEKTCLLNPKMTKKIKIIFLKVFMTNLIIY